MSCLSQKPHGPSVLARKVSVNRRGNGDSMSNAGTVYRGHRAALIFLTGLSGSGKSTLASGLEQRLRDGGLRATVIDGDILRAGPCKDLGFSDADRRENIRRATELALIQARAGFVVIV